MAHLRRQHPYDGQAGRGCGHRPFDQPGQGAELLQDQGA